ncbi:MAG: HAMP domain-containing protein [Acidobacteria bacterium]|nr:HAMP domain-containing protein [Acidobacteriota bacterium]
MNRLRNRLVLLFVAATLAPVAATVWIAGSLLEHSLSYSTTDQVDALSKALEATGREFYQRSRESLKQDAQAGRLTPRAYTPADLPEAPPALRNFFESGEEERFVLSSDADNRLLYMVRRAGGVSLYHRDLGGVNLARLAEQFRLARQAVEKSRARDLRRGLLCTFGLLAAAVWVVSLAGLVLLAHRVSRPIQQLTGGLARLASGDLSARLPEGRDDEVGRALRAFNHTAAQLEQSRDRLVYLTQLASWQALARKTAHELKNSLTPIRLTMEELLARPGQSDRAFLAQAARIVVEEVESLERRVRAFSEFAAEPPVRPVDLDVNAAVEERVTLLRAAHPGLTYQTRLAVSLPQVRADEDLLKGILTNLLENAAEAAGDSGAVLVLTGVEGAQVFVEVHDSGPGLSEEARQTLFEPTISFKPGGMGLGLSIARKNALLAGGDILLVKGALGGAGFRVLLGAAPAPDYAAHPGR